MDRVAVGSTNPVKIGSARRVFAQFFPGAEVGPLVDGLSGMQGSKKKGGTIGFLTGGLVVREGMYTHMVAVAMVRFLHPELYSA